jgi:hypothetical protein
VIGHFAQPMRTLCQRTELLGPGRTRSSPVRRLPGGSARGLRHSQLLLENQVLVMEATTRIELVYTVLQTVA